MTDTQSVTITQCDNENRAKERARLWRPSAALFLCVTCGNRDIRDTFGTTQRDRVAVRDPRSMVTERHIGPFVTLGGRRR